MRIGSDTSRGWLRIARDSRSRLWAYCLMDNPRAPGCGNGEGAAVSDHGLSPILLHTDTSRNRRVTAGWGTCFRAGTRRSWSRRTDMRWPLLRYIHENPVKSGIAARAQAYRWSSDRDYPEGAEGPSGWIWDRLLPDAWTNAAGGAAQLPVADARSRGGVLRRSFELGARPVNGDRASADCIVAGGGGAARRASVERGRGDAGGCRGGGNRDSGDDGYRPGPAGISSAEVAGRDLVP